MQHHQPDSAILVQRFLSHLKRGNYSGETIRNYRHYLEKFTDWLYRGKRSGSQGCTSLRDATRETILAYWKHLQGFRRNGGRPYSSSTISGALKALRQFYGYLKRQELILVNPTEGLPSMRRGNAMPRCIMNRSETEALLRQPDLETLLGFRDRCMMEVLYSTAIRRRELAGLGIYDVDLSSGMLRITEGKGRRDRVVPIGKTASAYVKEYLARVRPRLQKITAVKALFLGRGGLPVSPQLVSLMVSRYRRKAGLSKPVSAHTLRHTCATAMLKGGSSVRHVQEMLGHAHIKTTQIYTRVMPVDVKKAHQKAHPRERMKNKVVMGFQGPKMEIAMEKKTG